MASRVLLAAVCLVLSVTHAAAQGSFTNICPPGNVTLRPVASTRQVPPYPSLSQMMGEQGTTMLTVTIDPDGSASDVSVFRSSGSLRLDDAAATFVKQTWKWEVTERGCGPAPVQTRVEVIWDLKNAEPAANPFIVIPLGAGDYPPDALAKQERGAVNIVLWVSAQGVVGRGEIITSSGFADLDQRALEIAKARYHVLPARLEGKPVPTVLLLTMVWTLPGSAQK